MKFLCNVLLLLLLVPGGLLADGPISELSDATTIGWENGPTGFARVDANTVSLTGTLNVDSINPRTGPNLTLNSTGNVAVTNILYTTDIRSSLGDIEITPNGGDDLYLDGIKWPINNGSNGQVLVTDGAGTSSWATAAAGDALTTDPLSQFAATTSAQLAGVISDESGSGALVFASSPTLVTPSLGDAISTDVRVRDGANPTEFRVYNTYDGTNDEWASFGWNTTANKFEFLTDATGTGTVRDLFITAGAHLEMGSSPTFQVYVSPGGARTWVFRSAGQLEPSADNTSDLGQAAKRVKIGYFGTRIETPRIETDPADSLTVAPDLDLYLKPDGQDIFFGDPSGNYWRMDFTGGTMAFAPYLDNVYDIGLTTREVANIYVGTTVRTPAITSTGDLALSATNNTITASDGTTAKELTAYETLTFFIPMTGVVDAQFDLTGENNEITAGETGDYTTDFGVGNQHLAILVNSITTGGVITITGTSVSEGDGLPTAAVTEDITVDTTGNQLYQTTKKWLEITNIDVSTGTIAGIDYDVQTLGYLDMGNKDFTVVGYRCESRTTSTAADLAIHIDKVQDDGSGKVSIVPMEDYGFDSTVTGGAYFDNLRTGVEDRDYTMGSNLADTDTMVVFKTLDFRSHFSGDENVIEGSTKGEGLFIHFEGRSAAGAAEGISAIDHSTVTIFYLPN